MQKLRGLIIIISLSLCVAISILIIFHSYHFLATMLRQEIAFLISLVIEIAFVSFSILGVISGRWLFTDKAIKILLFILSVIPATLYISQQSRELLVTQVTRQAPIEPKKPVELFLAINSKIDGLDKELESLRDFKGTYDLNLKSRTWYAFQDQKRIDALMLVRSEATNERILLEKEWSKKYNKYQTELSEFNRVSNVDDYTILFELIFLIWTLLVIIVLQFLNGRLSRNCAIILGTDADQEEHSQQLKNDLLKLIKNNATPTITEDQLKGFFQDIEIQNKKQLIRFISTDYATYIRNFNFENGESIIHWLSTFASSNKGRDGIYFSDQTNHSIAENLS